MIYTPVMELIVPCWTGYAKIKILRFIQLIDYAVFSNVV